jgi:hypothetical protein
LVDSAKALGTDTSPEGGFKLANGRADTLHDRDMSAARTIKHFGILRTKGGPLAR